VAQKGPTEEAAASDQPVRLRQEAEHPSQGPVRTQHHRPHPPHPLTFPHRCGHSAGRDRNLGPAGNTRGVARMPARNREPLKWFWRIWGKNWIHLAHDRSVLSAHFACCRRGGEARPGQAGPDTAPPAVRGLYAEFACLSTAETTGRSLCRAEKSCFLTATGFMPMMFAISSTG
jgi:hypothetical protein